MTKDEFWEMQKDDYMVVDGDIVRRTADGTPIGPKSPNPNRAFLRSLVEEKTPVNILVSGEEMLEGVVIKDCDFRDGTWIEVGDRILLDARTHCAGPYSPTFGTIELAQPSRGFRMLNNEAIQRLVDQQICVNVRFRGGEDLGLPPDGVIRTTLIQKVDACFIELLDGTRLTRDWAQPNQNWPIWTGIEPLGPNFDTKVSSGTVKEFIEFTVEVDGAPYVVTVARPDVRVEGKRIRHQFTEEAALKVLRSMVSEVVAQGGCAPVGGPELETQYLRIRDLEKTLADTRKMLAESEKLVSELWKEKHGV